MSSGEDRRAAPEMTQTRIHHPHRATFRLGVVAYLNMQPLVYGLDRQYGEEGLELCLGAPSRLAAWLAEGRIDVGMVPVAALLAHPEWSIVGPAMIGSRGAVASVLLAGGGPPAGWRRLRPDSHSLTSNALAAILTRRALGVTLEPAEPLASEIEDPPLPAPGEALVVIGSRALAWRGRLEAAPGVHVIDLGALWTQWTGLPLVCALWAARPGAPLGAWPERLEAQRRLNAGRLEEISHAWPDLAQDRLTPREAADYLKENLAYDFDAAARRGLLRFYTEGRALGLFPPGWDGLSTIPPYGWPKPQTP